MALYLSLQAGIIVFVLFLQLLNSCGKAFDSSLQLSVLRFFYTLDGSYMHACTVVPPRIACIHPSIHMCVCMHIYTLYFYIHPYACVCICIYIHTLYFYIHPYVYMYVCMWVCVCIYMYIIFLSTRYSSYKFDSVLSLYNIGYIITSNTGDAKESCGYRCEAVGHVSRHRPTSLKIPRLRCRFFRSGIHTHAIYLK